MKLKKKKLKHWKIKYKRKKKYLKFIYKVN